jgi:16S rRNA processing protein RimM
VTDFPERFVPGLRLQWRRSGAERELTVASARPHGARLLVRFDEIGEEESARELSDGDLWIRDEEAVPPPEDFYYSHRIEGWPCEDTRGRVLGRAAKLERAAGVPLLTIDAGGRMVLVPFTRPIVVSLDAERRRIVLDPPEGLMDL